MSQNLRLINIITNILYNLELPKEGEGDGHTPHASIEFLTGWMAQLHRAQPADQLLAQLGDNPEAQLLAQLVEHWED